jgi:hypothetical protein
MTSTDDFQDAMEHIAEAAIDLYGEKSPEHVSVCASWAAVGVPNDSSTNCGSATTDVPVTPFLNTTVTCNYSAVQIEASWGVTSGALPSGGYYDFDVRQGKYGVWADISTSTNTSDTDIYPDGLTYMRVKACNVLNDCSTTTSKVISKTCGGGGVPL